MARIPPLISPTIKAALKAWGRFMGEPVTDPNPQTIPFPITGLQLLIPDLNIKHWGDRCIQTVADIRIGPATKTFRTLQIEYGLSAGSRREEPRDGAVRVEE